MSLYKCRGEQAQDVHVMNYIAFGDIFQLPFDKPNEYIRKWFMFPQIAGNLFWIQFPGIISKHANIGPRLISEGLYCILRGDTVKRNLLTSIHKKGFELYESNRILVQCPIV